MAEKYAQALDGRIVKRRADEIVVLATRGAVERILRAEMESRTAPLDTELREHVCVGFGFGASASIAEEQGRLAIGRAGTPAHVSIGLADQEAAPVPVEGSEVARTVRERDLRTLRRLRISPSVVRRLGTAFRRIDPASFTATEFAPAYGVDPRSARRLIAELKDRGLVRECGIEKSNRVGRPKRAYRIALNRLAAALR
jgi:DNA-binding transcriptional ArsR family regulator